MAQAPVDPQRRQLLLHAVLAEAPARQSCPLMTAVFCSRGRYYSLRGCMPMIDFTKHIRSAETARRTDPIEIYDNLDRASDKGPLRPAQEAILREWYLSRRSERDVIVKLQTGQGKTVIGLLILQSKLNSGAGPCLYLCPNNFLVAQTCSQARQFGFKFVTDEGDLPTEFEDSEAILITSVHKLFNGKTRFRLGARSLPVGSIVIDDSHACLDAIRNTFTITLAKDKPAYQAILHLFSDSIRLQGEGTYQDILKGSQGAFSPVPYWVMNENVESLAKILSKHEDDSAIKFAWPLLRDILVDCLCIIAGDQIQIVPYAPTLSPFGSYSKATHRVFMSATVNDDSFFVKSLGVQPECIRHPLRYSGERWSGEKMILIPSESVRKDR
jgi:replicative superfamily II helicase